MEICSRFVLRYNTEINIPVIRVVLRGGRTELIESL